MADDQQDIKPCPFCGRAPEEVTAEINGKWITVIACNNGCGASGPFLAPPCDALEASNYALDRWNTRISTERIADALEVIANQKPTLWQVDVDGRVVFVHGEGGRDYLRSIDALVRTLRSELADKNIELLEVVEELWWARAQMHNDPE